MGNPFLIVGGDSQIGGALKRQLCQEKYEVQSTSRRHPPAGSQDISLDLADIPDGTRFGGPYHAAIICAGITDIRYCESHPEPTRFINVQQTLKLAKMLAERECFVVYLSTNLVFDGLCPLMRPEDPQSPKTEYGFQKTQVEQELIGSVSDGAIVRLSKVASVQWPIFKTWKSALLSGQAIQPFSDYFCSLVSMESVVGCLTDIAANRRRGIWHISAPDQISYADIARGYATFLGAGSSLIQPVNARESGVNLYLPNHTTLNTEQTVKEMQREFPASMKVLNQLFIDELRRS